MSTLSCCSASQSVATSVIDDKVLSSVWLKFIQSSCLSNIAMRRAERLKKAKKVALAAVVVYSIFEPPLPSLCSRATYHGLLFRSISCQFQSSAKILETLRVVARADHVGAMEVRARIWKAPRYPAV